MAEWIILSHEVQDDGMDMLEISVIGVARCRILFPNRTAEEHIETGVADFIAAMMEADPLYRTE